MRTLLQDLRFGLRMLAKNPGFTILAILILGFGIGVTTVIFSVVNAVLLRSLPYPDAERIVTVWESWRGEGTTNVAWPKYMDWREQQTVFESIAGADWGGGFTLTGGERPESVPGLSVAPAFFDVFKLKPLRGRFFNPDEAKPGSARIVVISEELWKSRFNGDPDIIGQTVRLNFLDHIVVGILPAGLRLASGAQLFVPRVEEGWLIEQRGNHSSQVFARLKPGMTIAQAEAEMNGIAHRLEQEYPDTDEHWRVKIVPLHEQVTGGLRSALLILLGAVIFLLLITCANVANLQLARAAGRQKEITIRVALGASRGRVVRQLLTENVALSLAGGTVGIVTAYWALDLLLLLGSSMLPNMITIVLDWRVLGFAVTVSILTGILFGLFPAFGVAKTEPVETLKEGGRGNSQSRRSRHARSALIVAETGLALVLLVAAGLMLLSFLYLSRVDPGFQTDNILTVRVEPPEAKYGVGELRHRFFNQIIENLESVPGVEAVGGNVWLPMGSGDSQIYTRVVGLPELPEGSRNPNYRIVTPGYFQAMDIPVRQGRVFDNRGISDSPPIAIINESFARRMFPQENPIGKHLVIGNEWWNDNGPQQREIIGIVGDVHQDSPGQKPKPEVYVPNRQSGWSYGLALVIRTRGNPKNLIPIVRNAIWDVDRDQVIGEFQTMEQVVETAVTSQRFNTRLLTVFAVSALILACLGIYGVVSYSISQCTHEIGIRLALGAQKRHVLGRVIGQGMTLVGLGLVLGLLGVLGLTRFLSTQLYGVTATDPVVIGSVTFLLACVAMLACYIPARRAAKVNPIEALRCV